MKIRVRKIREGGNYASKYGSLHGLNHRFLTRGQPVCIMRSAATFVNYVHNIKIEQQHRRLARPLPVILPRAASEPAHSKGYGPFP